MELQLPSILQHHCQLPGTCSPPLGAVWPPSKAPNFLSWLSYTPKQLQQIPQECCKHHRALNPPGKPQAERSHVSPCLQLSAKLLSCRNLLLANPLHSQSLHVCKILQKESSRAQSSIKTFGSATHLSLGVLPKCFKCLFKLGFFFHQIFALILTVLKTLFLLANFILQLLKLGRETKVLKCT